MTELVDGADGDRPSGPDAPTAPGAPTSDQGDAARGVRIDVEGVSRTTGDGLVVLDDVSFHVEPGALVAIVGGSGAGKTTLLETLAGVRPPSAGRVRFDGVDIASQLAAVRTVLGYVPQDDIIHAELPLAVTLRYAALLRLDPSTPGDRVDGAVATALERLDLHDRAATRVGALSGGQRKRASIAVELLTEPHVFFLDEPTSGLDPATSAELLGLLRRLADDGSTVVITTHAVQDLAACDRVVFLARGGRLAFAGTPDEALTHFGVARIEDVYVHLARPASADAWVARWSADAAAPPPTRGAHDTRAATGGEPVQARRRPGAFRQWWVLTRRTGDTIRGNALTLAILLGSPALVVAMFAVLFQPGAFDFDDPSPSATVMIIFWVAFGGFFFGLTYGLLQICTEVAIVRRERLVGLNLAAYLAAKVAVLVPFLLVVDVVMLGVLRALDRLPAAGWGTYLSLGVTLALDATAALALGLLTSAAVTNPAQATLALPLLCFPAVLFSGAILPVEVMAPVGRAIALLMPDRWAFEAIGRDLELRHLFSDGGSALGPPLLAEYGDAGTASLATYWSILIATIAVLLLGAWSVLVRRSRTATR
jgi:ABC-type multidrug transport system ATPase subunit